LQHFDFASVSVALSLDMNHTSCVDLITLWVSVFSLHNPVMPSTVMQYFYRLMERLIERRQN
jgi:hypothetical protein